VFWCWRVDPCGGWFVGRRGRFVDEALGGFPEGDVKNCLTCGVDGIGLAVMHLVRCHQADACVVMVLVVPVEEAAAEAPGVLDAAEALGKVRLIFEGFEVAFGEGVVVGGVRAVVRPGDTEIGQQQCCRLGLHGSAAIGMQGELARRHAVLGDGVIEQWTEQRGAFGVRHAPADHAAAEDVEDDIKVEVAPLGWPYQFGDVPGPDGVGRLGEEFGFPIDGTAELLAAFAQFAVLSSIRYMVRIEQ